MHFTLAQRQAIEHGPGHLQLIACAGSGKTEVLTQRVAHLLTPRAQAASPSQIVAFTFTERAARELRERIRARCRDAHGTVVGLETMFVGTMHAYCGDLLRRHRPELMKFRTLNQVQQHLLINRHSREAGLSVSTDLQGEPLRRFLDTALFAQAMDLLREASLMPDRLKGCSVWGQLPSYSRLLEKRRFFDFSAVISRAVEALEHDPQVRELVRAELRHLFVDEYQDTNPLQERLVRALSGLGAQVCVVGDDDQTIYQFRGSDVSNIQTFGRRYEGVSRLALEENFRSSEAIVALGRVVVEGTADRLQKAMRGASAQTFEAGDVSLTQHACPGDEAEHIARLVVASRGVAFREGDTTRGLDWSDMAVLCRSVKNTAPAIAAALIALQVPVVTVGLDGLFDALEVAAFRALFIYLADADADLDDACLRTSWESAHLGAAPPRLSGMLAWANKVRERLRQGGDRRHAHYGLQRVFWDALKHLALTETRVPDGRGESVYLNLGRFSQVISDFEVVNFHTPLADKYRSFAAFLVHQAPRAYGEGGRPDDTGGVNAVRIMTIHQAKGLQFPVVFVPGMVHGRFPAARHGGRSVWHLVPKEAVSGQQRYNGGPDDECRLFYVAVTRSQKFLHLSWAPIRGRPRLQRPSGLLPALAATPWVTHRAPDLAARPRATPRPARRDEKLEIGYSDLRQFVDCAYAYKLRVLCGFNPPLHEALGYGESLHNALAELHDRWSRGDLLDVGDVPDLIDRHLHLPYAYDALRGTLGSAATESLRRYVREARPSARRIQASERTLELDLGQGVTVRGRLDLLRVHDDGGTEIVDFKTSHGATGDAAASMQLLAYGAAVEAAGLPAPTHLTVHDLTTGRVRSAPASKGAFRDTLAELSGAAGRLKTMDYAPCANPDRCAPCDMRALCSAGRRVV